VIRRLLKFATHRTGAFETINLIITHLSRVSLSTMKNLLLQNSLEDGFNHINKKLVEILREPHKFLPEILGSSDAGKNDVRGYGSFAPAPYSQS
jgi:hypothetical protein